MREFEDRIEIEPNKQDLREVLAWLKEEKEHDIQGYGFYNNKSIIIDAFKSENLIIFKHKNKSIGLIVWNESEGIVIEIDIFVIHPSYRGKGFGEFYFTAISDHFKRKGFKAVKLFCAPEASEGFWKKMGLTKYPDCWYSEHSLTYYGVLVDVASTTYISNADKIELWDVEPCDADETTPKWTWYIENDTDGLLYPIVQPCNCNWNLRWSRNGVVVKEEKVKYFTGEYLELFRSRFLYIDKL